jgi:hypothetical protein
MHTLPTTITSMRCSNTHSPYDVLLARRLTSYSPRGVEFKRVVLSDTGEYGDL